MKLKSYRHRPTYAVTKSNFAAVFWSDGHWMIRRDVMKRMDARMFSKDLPVCRATDETMGALFERLEGLPRAEAEIGENVFYAQSGGALAGDYRAVRCGDDVLLNADIVKFLQLRVPELSFQPALDDPGRNAVAICSGGDIVGFVMPLIYIPSEWS